MGEHALRFRRPPARALPAIELGHALFVGPSPGRRGLERLARAGWRSIVDLDLEGEAGQPLSPNVEATWAHTFELEHYRLSLYAPPEAGDAEHFLEIARRAQRPTYVHSIVPDRALAFAALAWGVEAHLASAQVFVELSRRGLALASDEWAHFLARELDLRVGVPATLASPL